MASTNAAGSKPLPAWFYALCSPEAQALTEPLEQWALQTAAVRKAQDEAKDEVLKAKDEVLKAKDEAFKVVWQALDMTKQALDRAEQCHLQEICRYKLTYQIPETFTWLLCCLMDNNRDTAPGDLCTDPFSMMTEQGQGPSASPKLTADALQIYEQIRPHFEMGACTPTFVEQLRDQYRRIRGNKHNGKWLRIPHCIGLACGGESRNTIIMHTFIVLNVQALSVKLRLQLPRALRALTVINAELDSIVGDCVNGIFVGFEICE
jgi:hypothetical protein